MLRSKPLLAAGVAGLLLMTIPQAAAQHSPLASFYSRTDSVLAAHVVGGQVDYSALANHPASLHRLVGQIERHPDPRLHVRRFHPLTLRVDYGVNPLQPEQRGPVLGIGQYF